MSQAVASYLQRGDVAGGVVAIKLRYSDFTTLTRQMTLPLPSDDAVEIYRAALTLLERAWEPGRPVRLLGVGAHQLSQPSGQLSLFDNTADAAPGERFDGRPS
jgi:DNA polymerase-4